jgi:hypothetical protein
VVGAAALAAAAAHLAYLDTGLGHFLLLMLVIVPLLAACSACCTTRSCARCVMAPDATVAAEALRSGFVKAYCALLVIAGIVAWWLVLAHKSRQVAQEESNRQTHLLMREIESHRQTDEALQQAKRWPSRRARGRPGQPGQEPLHQRHQPRTAHAAEQHPGLRAADGRGRRPCRRTASRPSTSSSAAASTCCR